MHPYRDLPQRAFWRPAVSERNFLEISDLWQPDFDLGPQQRVATFGSCFAQHIGRALRQRGLGWIDAEPAPRGLADTHAADFGYRLFSARTGNIYTTAQLDQWLGWALAEAAPPATTWTTPEGGVLDPFRPTIEPGGFGSVDEMRRARAETLGALRDAVEEADLLVFTLGLTEAWQDRATGCEYPVAPGVAGGIFDPDRHVFVNHRFGAVRERLHQAIIRMRRINPRLRVLLTVSPVPLTATRSEAHVLVATSRSKAVLRTVADDMVADDPLVSYFPSYELITSPVFRGAFFAANQRQVAAAGVEFVMQHFFAGLGSAAPPASAPASTRSAAESVTGDEICDEVLLEAFAPEGS